MDMHEKIARKSVTEALVLAKLDGRRAIPRDELFALALKKSPRVMGRSRCSQKADINSAIDAGLSNGALKMKITVGTGKISLGKKREMKIATAANGFERASDLPSGVLAHVCSFAVSFRVDLAAWDTSSKSLSEQAPWRTLTMSHYPSLGLLVAADVDHAAWRGIYWRNSRMINDGCGAPLARAPPLSEYIFTWEIWNTQPTTGRVKVVECGTWIPGTGLDVNGLYLGSSGLSYRGAYLAVSLDSLSMPATAALRRSLRNGCDHCWLRSVVAKRGSMETFLLYDYWLFPQGDGRHHLKELSSLDLINGSSRYEDMVWRHSPPVIASPGLTDDSTHMYLALQWEDDDGDGLPMELSHFEQFLAHRADWS